MCTCFAFGTLALAAVHRLVTATTVETRRRRTAYAGIGLAARAKEACTAIAHVPERQGLVGPADGGIQTWICHRARIGGDVARGTERVIAAGGSNEVPRFRCCGRGTK